MHIAIAGNIGSGKTTLTKMLAKRYNWSPRFEPVEHNPYLDDFYHDMSRWSFNLQIYFLNKRFKEVVEISKSDKDIIQDRTIFEGVYVFAANNRKMGNMDQRDYETYMELFESMMEVVEMPELMIYLRSSVPHLVKNIQKRGRDYEQKMPLDYLEGINNLYEDFIMNKYKGRVLVVEVDDLDFEHNPKQFGDIIDKIDAKLFGFFS